MDFQELKNKMQMSLKEMGNFFNIPYRTIQDWSAGVRTLAPYILSLMNYKWENKDSSDVVEEVANFQELKEKMNLPLTKISEYFGIFYKNVQKWNTGRAVAPDYVISLMNYKWDCENKK